jgi:hypothetical protein
VAKIKWVLKYNLHIFIQNNGVFSFFIVQQFHDDVGKIKTTQNKFSAYMDASGIKEELVSLVASLSEAYICAGEVVN